MHVRLVRTQRVPIPRLVAAAGVLALLASVPGAMTTASGVAAGSSDSDYQDASLRLLEPTPGGPSGYQVRIDYTNPDDPEGKPPSVRKVVEIFPRGTRIDTGAPALCTASDAELMAQGPSACPAESIIGDGVIKLDTGVPGPGRYLVEGVTFLNNTGQLIFLTDDQATGARTVARAQVRGDRVISEAPFLPGAGSDGAAIDAVRGNFPTLVQTRDGKSRAYMTTPQGCAERGYWVTKIRFTYRDGTTQTESTRNPCR